MMISIPIELVDTENEEYFESLGMEKSKEKVYGLLHFQDSALQGYWRGAKEDDTITFYTDFGTFITPWTEKIEFWFHKILEKRVQK